MAEAAELPADVKVPPTKLGGGEGKKGVSGMSRVSGRGDEGAGGGSHFVAGAGNCKNVTAADSCADGRKCSIRGYCSDVAHGGAAYLTCIRRQMQHTRHAAAGKVTESAADNNFACMRDESIDSAAEGGW